MRSSFALLLLAWFLNVGQACPFEKQNDYHETNPVAKNHTLWRRVRTGPGGGTTAAPTISTLFTVGDESTRGGCSGREALINGWIQEAVLLQRAVETAYEDFNSNRRLMMFWAMFFGIRFDTASGTVDMNDKTTKLLWPAIGQRISSVSQFLTGAGLVGSQVPGNPWIFCSEDAGEYVPFGQPIKDDDGDMVAKSVENDIPEFLALHEVFPAQANNFNIKAFYMHAFKGYVMDQNGYDTLCGKPSLYACTANTLTNDIIEDYVDVVRYNRHILFCPPTFSPGTDAHSYPSLSQAVSSDHYPGDQTGLKLDQYVPVSATFYHELWHLTDGAGITGDPYNTLKLVLEAGEKQALDTYTNPESFVFFAVAVYMYLNPPEGKEAVLFMGGKPTLANHWNL